jgi:hypothetical protein
MKFRHYLESIAGVDIYPLMSLVIFFVFFAVLAFWAIFSDKQHINYLKEIPIKDDQQ